MRLKHIIHTLPSRDPLKVTILEKKIVLRGNLAVQLS